MKVQTTAKVKTLSLNGDSHEIKHSQEIELEFSAIDTGGGYKDPILDFSFRISRSADLNSNQRYELELVLGDPDNEEDEVSLKYAGELTAYDNDWFEVNGRLKEENLSRELIGFVLQRLR